MASNPIYQFGENIPQHEEMEIIFLSSSKLPVRLASISADGGAIELGVPFERPNLDWLRGMTIGIDNTSNKTMTFVEVELVFRPRKGSADLPAAWSLRIGPDPFSTSTNTPAKPIASPGDRVTLTVSDSQYENIQLFLNQIGLSGQVNRIEIQVLKLGFADGTAWNGRMYRRDPTNVNGALKG
jgi:hypothetical protein